MSSRRLALRWILAVVTLVVTGSAFVRSQERGLEELKKDLDTGGKYRTVLFELLRGDTTADPKNELHNGAISTQTEYLARQFVDPVFLSTPPNPSEKEKNKTLTYLIGRVEVDLAEMTRSKRDIQPVAAMYTHYFGLHAKNVILSRAKGIPVAALNLTRALEKVAVLGQGELANVLVDLIEEDLKKDALPEAERLKDPEKLPNDGVKYYALRGLQKLLAQPPKPPALTILTGEQEEKVVKLMQKLIVTSQTFKDGTSQQEIDGFRVRRREAVKVLAAIPISEVPNKKDELTLTLPRMVTLLRVVAREKAITPEPTIEERLEAAIGLARIKFGQLKDFNPDYAVHHIGLFVDEFATYCNTENKIYDRPVRIYASRLIEALDGMKNEIANSVVKRTEDERKYVNEAADKCRLVLAKIETSSDGTVNKSNNYALDKFAAIKVPNNQLFKGVDGTAVPPPPKK